MQAQKFLQDLKTSFSFSCLASWYLLRFTQANDLAVNLLHLYISLFRGSCEREISLVIIHDWYLPSSLVVIVKQ